MYRANDISNFDAAAVHCRTADNADIYFYTAHPVEQQHDVEWCYEFEHGSVTYTADPEHPDCGRIIGRLFAAGQADDTHVDIIDYGNPDDNTMKKIWDCLDTLQEMPVNRTLPCSVAAARAHVVCVNAAQESMPAIVDLDNLQEVPDQRSVLVYHPEMLAVWRRCYQDAVMPSDCGFITKPVNNTTIDALEDYRIYPTFS